MRNIKLTIQYDGCRYQGWQRLKNTHNTIQEKIESVLTTLTKEPVQLVGSGRTDAGVHAEGQVANFLTHSNVPLSDLLSHCYSHLPQDIVVQSAEVAPEAFHARFDALDKTYRYTIDNGPRHQVFARKTAFHVPKGLDISAMLTTAQIFLGEREFRSFTKLQSKTKSTVRTLYSLTIVDHPPFCTIRLKGNGFLYKMARLLVGALIANGLHQLSREELIEIRDRHDKNNRIEPAPPHGLCLEGVRYS